VQLRIGVRSPDKAAVERFTREIAPLILNGPPSVTGSPRTTEAGGDRGILAALLDRRTVSRASRSWTYEQEGGQGRRGRADGKNTVPLVELAHARSGDKGDTANVGLIALKPEYYPILVKHVTAARVARHFKG